MLSVYILDEAPTHDFYRILLSVTLIRNIRHLRDIKYSKFTRQVKSIFNLFYLIRTSIIRHNFKVVVNSIYQRLFSESPKLGSSIGQLNSNSKWGGVRSLVNSGYKVMGWHIFPVLNLILYSCDSVLHKWHFSSLIYSERLILIFISDITIHIIDRRLPFETRLITKGLNLFPRNRFSECPS